MDEIVDSGRAHTPEEVLAAVNTLAREVLDHGGQIDREQRLVEDLELDSIRLLSLATAVEDHFHIMLDEEDEAGIETVGDLVDLILAKADDENSAGGADGHA